MKEDSTPPCKNCITYASCLARVKAIKEAYIEEGIIGDDNMMVNDPTWENYNQFDADVINELNDHCELFSEYFPYTDANGSIQYPYWFIMNPDEAEFSEKKWRDKVNHINDIFANDYPDPDDGEKAARARYKERKRLKRIKKEEERLRRERAKRKAKKIMLKFD